MNFNETTDHLVNNLKCDSFIKTLDYYLHRYWIEECDPRTREYTIVTGGPQRLLAIMCLWLLFVTKIGPQMMANRKPFDLRRVMFIYNIVMVILNAYFFTLSIRWLDYGRRIFEFQFPSREDTSEATLQQIDEAVLYAYTKYFDLFDTIFFVLRKKQSHLTFLHLYHHFMVPVLGWATLKLGPTCQAIGVFAILNTLVHTIMYSYYGLSAFGPFIQKYLWLKRYITLLQISQFVFFITYGLFHAYLASGWPIGLYWICWIQSPLFLTLFLNFYRRSYNNSKKVAKFTKLS